MKKNNIEKDVSVVKEEYNQSNIENKTIKLEMNIKLRDIRLLSRYLEDELIVGLGNILTQLEENSEIETFEQEKMREFYNGVYDVFNEMAEVVYRGLIEKEKSIIDSLKQQGIPVDGVIEILAKEPNDEERILNIYEAVDDLEFEKNEAKTLAEALPEITRKIVNKLDSDINSLYMPLVIKFISFLSDTTRSYNNQVNEAIFSESALEELLDLDIDALDIFLTKLMKIRVKVGDVEGFIIDDFTIYNNTTVIVYYPIFITNPVPFQKRFLPLDSSNIEVSFEA
jgi:DNA-binding transcriptional MerR regulator